MVECVFPASAYFGFEGDYGFCVVFFDGLFWDGVRDCRFFGVVCVFGECFEVDLAFVGGFGSYF